MSSWTQRTGGNRKSQGCGQKVNILYRRTQTARTKLIRTIKKKKKDKGNDLMDKDMRKRIRTRRDTDELKIEKDKS